MKKLGILLSLIIFFIISTILLKYYNGFSNANKQFILTDHLSSQKIYPKKYWLKIENPEDLGWSLDKLNLAHQYSKKIGATSVVVIYRGVIIVDWGDINRKFKLYSIRKSLINALYGIAIYKKMINLTTTLDQLNINDKDSLSQGEKQATIEDLLCSKSGVFHPAAYETDSMKKNRPQRNTHAAGAFYFYNNWDFNVLLTIYEKQTKTTVKRSFYDEIAKPLQMQSFKPNDMRYFYQRKYSLHPAYLFKMTPLDLARFGLLYLRNGQWGDKQIISENWIKKSSTPCEIFNEKKRTSYGFLWNIKKDYYYAAGNGGQRLVIYPNKGVIIIELVYRGKDHHRVKSKKFWHLADMILSAKQN